MPKPKQTKRGGGSADDYRHRNKRTNIPPSPIAGDGPLPPADEIIYHYNPRKDPILRFDCTGKADRIAALVEKAKERPLSPDEASLLMQAIAIEDPWLEWASKRENEATSVEPVALHAHERISTKALLKIAAREDINRSLFADPQYDSQQAIEFYRHEMDWSNRLILGDSMQVMASLAQREDLGGKIKMIYFDPPYGIKYSGNFQTKINKTGAGQKEEDLTREPEMIKAYRDTWNLGIHSYLTYLRDRLRASKDLLHETGSIFIQIGEENLPLVSLIADEVLGRKNRVQLITFKKKSSTPTGHSVADYILWYAKDKSVLKPNDLRRERGVPENNSKFNRVELPSGERRRSELLTDEEKEQYQDNFAYINHQVMSQHFSPTRTKSIIVQGKEVPCNPNAQWRYDPDEGMRRLERTGRLRATSANSAAGVIYWGDFNLGPLNNIWDNFHGQAGKVYVVQTNWKVVEQCMLLCTKPGDIVLDPTCGSGTTAYVAEKWGRRWISIDTSRVAIAIARKRLMTSLFQYYKLKDAVSGVSGDFQYKTVAEVSLRSIAKNENLDPILDKHDAVLAKCLESCNRALDDVSATVRHLLENKLQKKGQSATEADLLRWKLPEKNEGFKDWTLPFDTDNDWPETLRAAVKKYRIAWRSKMDEVNACIKKHAPQIELIDKPIVSTGVTRVCGPFTVESVLPTEIAAGKTAMKSAASDKGRDAANADAFIERVVHLMQVAGIRFLNNKQMKFINLVKTGGGFDIIHAQGKWVEKGALENGDAESIKVALVCGPRYGPVTALQVNRAGAAAAEGQFEDLIIAGFSFDGTATAVINKPNKFGVRIHQAHINPDLAPGMDKLLKAQHQSQLFTVFGKPRIEIIPSNLDNRCTVRVCGIDIYDPIKNDVFSGTTKDIAAWFLDGNYDGRTFCVTQAFFSDKSSWKDIAKSLGAVVDPEAFERFQGIESLPFSPGEHRTVAIKVIDIRGNEVMDVRTIED